MYYAHSRNGGLTFEPNLELFAAPPALDMSLVELGFQILEYIGITYDSFRDEVLTSFTGAHDPGGPPPGPSPGPDPLVHNSVIWSSRIFDLPDP